MNILKTFSPLLKEPKLIDDLPVIIRLRKFDETAAKEFSSLVSKAQNTGQPVLPIVIDSYGGQVYSLMSMISDIKHSRIPVATIVSFNSVAEAATPTRLILSPADRSLASSISPGVLEI